LRLAVTETLVLRLRAALKVTKGNVKDAAALLGVSRRTMHRMLKEHPEART
jgi:transcriptional regulator of acetoin/glycerol metabolism